MNTDIPLGSGPYFSTVLLLLFAFIFCPILAVTFFIASAVLYARKERKPAFVFALLGLLSTLPPLALGIVMWMHP